MHSTDIFKQQVLIHTKIAGRNINNCSYAGDTTLMAEREELKKLFFFFSYFYCFIFIDKITAFMTKCHGASLQTHIVPWNIFTLLRITLTLC